jgi:PiT family inorganic phosphate transporter
MWVGPWGLLLDAVVAAAIVLALFMRSLASRVDHANALSDVAESGHAVDIKGREAKGKETDRA